MAIGKNENQTIRLTGLAQSDESALNLGLRQYMLRDVHPIGRLLLAETVCVIV